MISPSYEDFLCSACNADTTRHSGRTLLEHLKGTHDLLKSWELEPNICTAGLFHSIYGTNMFRHQSWPLADRRTIQMLIGEHAERLVHTFCTIDRPRALFAAPAMLRSPILQQLREIEAANLLEQGSLSSWLNRLQHDPKLSQGARIAIRKRFAAAVIEGRRAC